MFCRVRISSCGVIEILTHDTPQDMNLLQQEDLAMFGRLILALACGNPAAAAQHHVHKAIETVARTFGADISGIVLWLLGKQPGLLRVCFQRFQILRGFT